MGRNLGVGALALGAFFTLSGSAIGAELTNKPVTFTKDVAPIFQAKCQDCHRKGSMAPMSLLTYEESRPWAKAIKAAVLTAAGHPVGVQLIGPIHGDARTLALAQAIEENVRGYLAPPMEP